MSLNSEFHRLKIAEVRRETGASVSIRFEIPDSLRDTFRFKAGQHLTLRALIDGEDTRRNYSVCAAPHENELRIAVKHVPNGRFSRWANTELLEGQWLDVLPPMGRFVLPEDDCGGALYVAIAGGSGITPVLSILKSTLERDDSARFALFYGNYDSSSILFLEELAGLKNRYLHRLEIYHFLENEAEEVELFNGRLSREKCDEILSTLVDVSEVDSFFICGPGPMMDAAEAALANRAVAPEKINIERFTTGEISAERLAQDYKLQQSAVGTELTITLDGRRSRVMFDADMPSILDVVRAAGLAAPYACKSGVCTTCRAKVLSGDVAMKMNFGLTGQEVAQGYVLTCQAVPTTANVSLTYDA
jgi:ring-1,2-phenylacetyl-CoA epoxidase subunit PaaE